MNSINLHVTEYKYQDLVQDNSANYFAFAAKISLQQLQAIASYCLEKCLPCRNDVLDARDYTANLEVNFYIYICKNGQLAPIL